MRAAFGLSVCLVVLIGCASPKPAATTAGPLASGPVKETEDQRAQRLVNYSIESGESISTAEGQKLICREERATTTRLKNRKICLTQAQWTERSNSAKDAFQNTVRDAQVPNPKEP